MPHTEETSPPQFSFWVTVAFTLNYVVGSGFLTLPWAFQQTGVIIGVMILLIIGFFSILSTNFILEAEDRGQQYEKFRNSNVEMTSKINKNGYLAIDDDQQSTTSDNFVDSNNGENDAEDEENNSLTFSASQDGDKEAGFDTRQVERKIEITELCEIFMGTNGRHCYTLIVTVYMYGTLWAYSTVFAHSFAAHLNVGEYSYLIYLALFACIVVPASLMEFSEQVSVQVCLSIFRVVMMCAMIGTVVAAQVTGANAFGENSINHFSKEDFYRMDYQNMHFLMPIAAYAYIFHHSIPSLAHPVADKKSLTTLFATAMVLSIVFYIAIGAVVSSYFGIDTEKQSNLNWTSYVGLLKTDGSTSYVAHALSFFIVLFPAVDVASAYPLNAYTLGNNIMSAYYGREVYKHDKIRWELNLFRTIAAVPPIFAGAYITDVTLITDYTGLTAFALAFVIPSLLSHYSAKKLEAVGMISRTVHSSQWTSPLFQALLGVSGILLFVYVGSGLLASGNPE